MKICFFRLFVIGDCVLVIFVLNVIIKYFFDVEIIWVIIEVIVMLLFGMFNIKFMVIKKLMLFWDYFRLKKLFEDK